MKKLIILTISLIMITSLCIISGVYFTRAAAFSDDFRMDNSTLVEYSGADEEVIIPSGVKEIGTEAFVNNTSIQKVVIPASVETIAYSAFSGCSQLNEVVIPDKTLSVGASAFANCTSLEKVTLGKNLENIGSGVFAGCTKLTEVSINDDNEHFVCLDGALYSADRTVLYQVFPGRLKNYFVMNSKTCKIDQYAFWGCEHLQFVTVSDILEQVDDYAFSNCKSLQAITLSYAVKRIGMKAFEDCVALEQIYVPISVSDIHQTAFDGCKKLAFYTEDGFYPAKYAAKNDIRVMSKPKYTTDRAEVLAKEDAEVSETELLTIVTIPQSEVEENGNLLGSTNVVANNAMILLDNSNQEVITGELDSPYQKILKQTQDGCIKEYAFYQNKDFDSIVIPDKVKEIGSLSFARSQITSVTIPESVTTISYGAFYHCDKLTQVTIPASVTSIEEKAFDNTPWIDNWRQNSEDDYLIVGDGILLAYKCADEDFVMPQNVKSVACKVPQN